jgi:hypothetical protein
VVIKYKAFRITVSEETLWESIKMRKENTQNSLCSFPFKNVRKIYLYSHTPHYEIFEAMEVKVHELWT